MLSEGYAVTLDRLEKRFGDFVAVDKVSLQVRTGEIFGFLGPNGAGKSTIIRMLSGLLAPSGGNGSVAGFDIVRETEKIKEHIGYMSQKFSLYEDLTVAENIDFYSGIYRIPKAKKKERREWAIGMAGLAEHRHARTSTLSGGWKQRLALGCAVLHEPSIVFLDEPTSGVDPISRRTFWDLIYELAGRGVTVFVTTHYMEEAEYCDHLGLIYRGTLIASGTSEELKTELMEEEIVDVQCERPQDIMARISSLGEVKEAALFGKGLHVVTANADQAVPAIRRIIEEEKVAVQKISKVKPSLEDVFVSLIEAQDRKEEEKKKEIAR
jgi:ABC-2 type transport system ATP-binding protein